MTQSALPVTQPAQSPVWVAAVAGGLTLCLLAVFAFPSPLWLSLIAILGLGWWLPGVLLALLWRLPDVDLPAFLLYALGLGLCWLIAGALAVHYMPGAISRTLLLAVYGAGALALSALLLVRAPVTPKAGDAQTWRWALLLLLLAGALRLPGLGYHEFHADEVVLLRQARRAVEGQDDALAEHTKGPGEIATALAVYRALGTANETTARLPFALMSAGSVLALAWLGARMVSGATGVWAGVLLATNGFALGLSRIAQYQPAVLFFSVLAVLAMWEFSRAGECHSRKGGNPRAEQCRWLALAAAFSAFGMVMHYEFALLAPALLYLGWRGWQRPGDRRALVYAGIASAVAGIVVVVAAYAPALLHPHFSTTQGYLSNRMGAIGTFNIAFFAEMGTFYNSTYYFAGLVALAAIGTGMGWRRARTPVITLTLWWLPFFVLYIFVIRFPGTHFYLLMESWCLLAAIPLAAVCHSRRVPRGRGNPLRSMRTRPALRWTAFALIGVWLLVSTHYLYLMFFRQEPEYLINIDTQQVPFYWAPFAVPEKPRFGFPIQEGWKAVGALGAWGYLPGSGDSDSTYNSNDRAWSLRRWYLRPFDKVDFAERPDYLFVAKHPQEADPEFDDAILDEYVRSGEVRVRGEPRLEIWARNPLPAYVVYDAEDFAQPFLHDVASLEPWPDPTLRVAEAALGDSMTLQSAHLDRTRVAPGDTLPLLLVWRPEQPLPQDYKLFVHVAGADGRPVAQWDGLPGLNTARTSQWPAGEPFRDHVFVRIPDDAPPGEYTLLAGLYDGETGARLGDAAIPIATVEIR